MSLPGLHDSNELEGRGWEKPTSISNSDTRQNQLGKNSKRCQENVWKAEFPMLTQVSTVDRGAVVGQSGVIEIR